jgi:alpha-L-rhamnosidase
MMTNNLTMALTCGLLAFSTGHGTAMTVTNLRCEYRSNPLGVDVAQPRLGWTLESSRRGETQTAYQVLVASSQALLDQNKGDLWDSGQVSSTALNQIP